jgi:membrane protease subunit (stomatin/prohibitin family)
MTFRGKKMANQFELFWSDDSTANSYFRLHTKGTYEIKISDVSLFCKK